ncbi:MAG TPA: hypothetical protein VFX59_10975 [Polyangiales bacterium]|nr:hypothetical protein [Polyangiales bacterium]
MSWRRGLAVAVVALALVGGWTGVRAQPEAPAKAGRTTTRLKPQHTLLVDAGLAGASDAGVADARLVADAEVDAGALPPDYEPPPADDLPPVDELPPAPEQVMVSSSLPPGVHGYGRQDPLLPHVRLDGHVALTWEGAFGVGVRADWLLIEGTFKYSSRDELAISAGADVTFVKFNGTQVVEVFPTVVLQWAIGVDDRLYLFPELGFIGHVDDGKWDGLFPNIGFGTRYYLTRSLGIQARFGWPIAFTAGAVF